MRVVGIDPGKTGCIAEIWIESGIVRYMPLPYRVDGVLNGWAILNAFNFDEIHLIAMELPQGMKVWGSTNNFNFGRYVGQIEGLLSEYPFERIYPKTWQKHYYKREKNVTAKKQSRSAFDKICPKAGKIPEGAVEAYLIANYFGKINNVVMPTNCRFSLVTVDS